MTSSQEMVSWKQIFNENDQKFNECQRAMNVRYTCTWWFWQFWVFYKGLFKILIYLMNLGATSVWRNLVQFGIT